MRYFSFEISGFRPLLLPEDRSFHSAVSSGPALFFVGTWLWLTTFHSLHGCHLPGGPQGICSFAKHLLCCLLVVDSLLLWSSCLSFVLFGHIYLAWLTIACPCCCLSGEVNKWFNVLLNPGIQLDVILVEEVADECSTLELLSIATLCDDLTEEIQAYAEQQHVVDLCHTCL